MLKELLIKDVSITRDDLIKTVLKFSTYEIDNICTYSNHVKYLKDIQDSVSLVPIIDFPNGFLTQEKKSQEIKSLGFIDYAQLDYCVNMFLLSNREYGIIGSEMRALKSLSSCGNIRPIVEYSSTIDSKVVEDFFKISKDQGIDTIILSTTNLSDNISNDRIFCVMAQNLGMKCIVSNKFFNKEKINKIKESKPYGLRSLSISSFSDIVYNQ